MKEKANKKGIQLKTESIVAKKTLLNTILEYVEEHNINLVVVGTRGRSGIKKMLLG
ncbi:MAG: universal stress protein, partial [Nitrosopumilales archaeon]